MKIREILFLLSIPSLVLLLSGCAATRPVSDAALGTGGAYAGYELSGGSPVPVPKQTVDGAVLQPTTKYLRIEPVFASGMSCFITS